MKILFAGTPSIAVPVLQKIADKHEIVSVLTAPDARAGRGKKLFPSEVKSAAEELCLSVLSPEKLNTEVRIQIAELQPDLLVCFAYRKIFGPKFLALFPLGGLNIHPSLLPIYRGPSPITEAIMNRDSETGISIQRLALEMDTGDILEQITLPLDFTETTGSLTDKAAVLSCDIVLSAIEKAEKRTEGLKQDDEKASYCTMISKQDGYINWNSTVMDIEAKMRAYNPWPKSFTFYGNKRLTIYEAVLYNDDDLNGTPGFVSGMDKKAGILIQTKKGILGVKKLQLEGKKVLEWSQFLNGNQEFIDSTLCTHGEKEQ